VVVFGFKTFYEVFLFILTVALAITIYRLPLGYNTSHYEKMPK
jgi:hypothetical protein